jgi:hypothetical protein
MSMVENVAIPKIKQRKHLTVDTHLSIVEICRILSDIDPDINFINTSDDYSLTESLKESNDTVINDDSSQSSGIYSESPSDENSNRSDCRAGNHQTNLDSFSHNDHDEINHVTVPIAEGIQKSITNAETTVEDTIYPESVANDDDVNVKFTQPTIDTENEEAGDCTTDNMETSPTPISEQRNPQNADGDHMPTINMRASFSNSNVSEDFYKTFELFPYGNSVLSSPDPEHSKEILYHSSFIKFIDPIGDGSCYFRVISLAIFGRQDMGFFLRNLLYVHLISLTRDQREYLLSLRVMDDGFTIGELIECEIGDRVNDKRDRQKAIMESKIISDVEAAFEIFVQDIAIYSEYIFSVTHIIMDLSFGINSIIWKQYKLDGDYTRYVYMAENTRNYVPRSKYMETINLIRCNVFKETNIRVDHLLDHAIEHHLLMLWLSSRERGMPKDDCFRQPKDQLLLGNYKIKRLKFSKCMKFKNEKDSVSPVDYLLGMHSQFFVEMKSIPEDGDRYEYADQFIKKLFDSCEDSTSFKVMWGIEDLWKCITRMVDYYPVTTTERHSRKRKNSG